jgi:hypothetical protein
VEAGKSQAGSSGTAAAKDVCVRNYRNGKNMCFCGGLRRDEEDEWLEDTSLIPRVFRANGQCCGSLRSQTECRRIIFRDIPDAWPAALVEGLNNNGSGPVCQPCQRKINDAQAAATKKFRV